MYEFLSLILWQLYFINNRPSSIYFYKCFQSGYVIFFK